MSKTPKIVVTDLVKRFGTKTVLDGVNVDIEEGKSLVIIGGSGSGKSVLLKNIIGLMTPTSGSITIDGKETAYLTGKKREEAMHQFGYLFQGGALFDSLPIWENVAFGLLQGGMSRSDAKEQAIENLRSVGLDADVADLFSNNISGGMQKRVSLARAIATNPDILFFDEPTTGLDPITQDIINDLMVHTSKQVGATTITITHNMKSAYKIADKIAMLYEGKIIWAGHPDDIKDSGNAHVDQLIHGKAEGPIQLALQDH